MRTRKFAFKLTDPYFQKNSEKLILVMSFQNNDRFRKMGLKKILSRIKGHLYRYGDFYSKKKKFRFFSADIERQKQSTEGGRWSKKT